MDLDPQFDQGDNEGDPVIQPDPRTGQLLPLMLCMLEQTSDIELSFPLSPLVRFHVIPIPFLTYNFLPNIIGTFAQYIFIENTVDLRLFCRCAFLKRKKNLQNARI
ncbi:hypothetical protein BDA99DRAFT_501858 [Phascolomyces articulosus]|uniref:Uncharacterized protein n=1 Tax=Phascolomyces articulosus TaxID=60185 RepID=A0AAD5KL92_9FUNG|nr:hypothetical protein BDA99DRAFT_501858 [Phascolomyces articulosus]